MINKTKIKKSDINKRLDILLAEKLDLSRSQIQKIIKNNNILVNNKKTSAHYKVKEGDEIEIKNVRAIHPSDEHGASELPQPKNKIPKFKTIAETDDYLVINKPSGLTVHGGENINEPVLTDALLEKWPEIKKVGDDPERPGIVHRLDKEASGLMVVAKTNAMFEHLKKQFKDRKTKKEYTALVYGKIEKDEDIINFPISRSVQRFKMAAHSKKHGGKIAITEFEIIKKFINYTLIKVKTKTGRPHQVRVHLSAYGHPLVGDNLYSTKKTLEKNKKLGLKRVFLHADYLGFYDLNNVWQEFRINLSKEPKDTLKNIK